MSAFFLAYNKTIDSINHSGHFVRITYSAAASSSLTLEVMLVVVLLFIPPILAYQVWACWLFSKKIETEYLIYQSVLTTDTAGKQHNLKQLHTVTTAFKETGNEGYYTQKKF